MVEPLQSLVRIRSYDVDQRRRALVSAQAALDHVRQMQQDLEDELRREQDIALRSPALAGFHYDNYADTVIQRRERLAEAVVETQKFVDIARNNLMTAYTELKKFEQAEELRMMREKKHRDKKEQEVLDEIAGQAVSRKPRGKVVKG